MARLSASIEWWGGKGGSPVYFLCSGGQLSRLKSNPVSSRRLQQQCVRKRPQGCRRDCVVVVLGLKSSEKLKSRPRCPSALRRHGRPVPAKGQVPFPIASRGTESAERAQLSARPLDEIPYPLSCLKPARRLCQTAPPYPRPNGKSRYTRRAEIPY